MPMMTDADMAMKMDPTYRAICEKFMADPAKFDDAFARAWFKLTHRDMGPNTRYLGPDAPARNPDLAGPGSGWPEGLQCGGGEGEDCGFGPLDRRHGHDRVGFRPHLPQVGLSRRRQWRAHPPRTAEGLGRQRTGPPCTGARRAGADRGILRRIDRDVIVLAGNVGIEKAAKAAGFDITVPFAPGRGDATAEMTDADSFKWLEPVADGFRNWQKKDYTVSPEELLLDRAQLMDLTAAEMTVLVGGMRALAPTMAARSMASSPPAKVLSRRISS